MPIFIKGLKGDDTYHLNLFYNNSTCEWPIGHWVIYCIAWMSLDLMEVITVTHGGTLCSQQHASGSRRLNIKGFNFNWTQYNGDS